MNVRPVSGAVLVGLASTLLSSCAMIFPPRDLDHRMAEAIVVSAGPGPLEAGAAKVDITPQGSVFLGGFGIARLSEGVHDRLQARALALRRGPVTVVIVAADLIGLHHHQVQEVRRRLRGRVPQDMVLVAATHNHSGPDTLGLWGIPPFVSGLDEGYLEIAIQGMVEAAEKALGSLSAVRVRWGDGDAPEWVTRNLREPGLIDRRVTALAFDRPEGAPVATLVHFACHPEVLGSSNKLISVDFPAALCAALEEARPGSLAIFLNGPLGGMVTAWPKAHTFEEVERIGQAIACAALQALDSGTAMPEEVELVCARQPIMVPIQNPRYHLGNFFGLFGGRPYRGGYTPSEVMALRLGPAVLLTAPGEVLPRVGFELEALSEARPFLVASLGNDELGYLIHEEDFAKDLYAYERTVSPGPLAVTLLRQAASDVLSLLLTPTREALALIRKPR